MKLQHSTNTKQTHNYRNTPQHKCTTKETSTPHHKHSTIQTYHNTNTPQHTPNAKQTELLCLNF